MRSGEREFIEQLVTAAAENGLPRTAARLLGHLLLAEGPLSLDQLAEQTGMSKASVSLNARWLEQFGVVQRLASVGDRRDYYRIIEEPWEWIFTLAERRMKRMHGALAAGCELLPPEAEVGRRRVSAWRRFYAFFLDDLSRVWERWQAYQAREAGEAATAASTDPLEHEGRRAARP